MTADEQMVNDILAQFNDGFQWSDVMSVVPKLMDYAESFMHLDGPAKKQKVLDLCQIVLDRTDGPGPDFLVDRGIMWVLPNVIDSLVDAAKGKFSFG